MPSFATAHNFDAHAPLRFYLTIVALTIIVPLLLRPLLPRLRPSIAIASWAFALWFATTHQDLLWVIAIGIAGIAAALIPYDARTRFRRADAILIPTFATLYLAMIDLAPSLSLSKHAALAAAIVLATRLAAGSGDAFVFAPLGLVLQAHFNALHFRHNPWPPLLIAVVTPLLLRRRRFPRLLAFAIYPIVALAFASASSKLGAEGKPHGDLFEDAHHFVVASEMLRGEKPYADIIPIHGFIDDGLLDYVVARTGPVTEGRLAKMHGVISSLNAVATYAVAAAATGSPHVGILSYFLAVTLGLGGGSVRLLPAMAALAFMAAAVRAGRPRLLAYAGALVVLAALTSLDFGAYSFVALVIAVLVPLPARGERVAEGRVRGAIHTCLGIIIAGIVVAIALAAAGILVPFLKTTLFDIAPIGAASSIDLPPLPPAFPELLGSVFAPRGLPLLALGVALVTIATVRNKVLIVLAAFAVAAGIYFFERQQFYFAYALPPLIAASIFYLWRRSRAGAVAALAVVLVAANLTNCLITLAAMWNTRGPLGEAAEVTSVPRATGALFTPNDAQLIEDVDRYARERLGVGDTFFDFADVPNLYFLLNRDCPVRQIAVPFFETEAAQRDVIARIARNPHVRAALVRADPNAGIDGVPNSVRAPLVWRWLQANFAPDVRVGEIVIWRRVW